MAKKKQKIDKPITPKKTTQTIHVTKELFDKINNDEVDTIIQNEALNYKLTTVTIKSGKNSTRKKPAWVKWLGFGDVTNMDSREAGYKNVKELEKELKKEKSGLRSNSPISLIKLY